MRWSGWPIRRALPRERRPVRSRRNAGFTLIEAALTTVIVGTGILALVAAQQAFMKQNAWAQRAGTGMLLASELRELTLTLPLYDPLHGSEAAGASTITHPSQIRCVADLIAADGEPLIFGPDGDVDGPINARPAVIADLDQWRQHVHAFNVPEDRINASADQAAPAGSTDMIAVIVTVQYQDPQSEQWEGLSSHRWVVTR